MGRTKSERAMLKEQRGRGVEKESSNVLYQDRNTRTLLGHFIVCVHFVRACVRKRTRMTAQRVHVHGFKNCAPPSLLSGKQTWKTNIHPGSTIEREGKIEKDVDRKRQRVSCASEHMKFKAYKLHCKRKEKNKSGKNTSLVKSIIKNLFCEMLESDYASFQRRWRSLSFFLYHTISIFVWVVHTFCYAYIIALMRYNFLFDLCYNGMRVPRGGEGAYADRRVPPTKSQRFRVRVSEGLMTTLVNDGVLWCAARIPEKSLPLT